MYLIKENINKPKIAYDTVVETDYSDIPFSDLLVTHKLKSTPVVFKIGKLLALEKSIYEENAELFNHKDVEVYKVYVNDEYTHVQIASRINLSLETMSKVSEVPVANLDTKDLVLNRSSNLVSIEIFELIKPYIEKKYIITFDENVINYASLSLNHIRRGLEKQITREEIQFHRENRDKFKKCWIEGCNADFKVFEDENNGMLISKTENLTYDYWDNRGDDPKRIPLVFKKPTDI